MINLDSLEKRLSHMHAGVALLLVFPHNGGHYRVWIGKLTGELCAEPMNKPATVLWKLSKLLHYKNISGNNYRPEDDIYLALFRGYGRWYVYDDQCDFENLIELR